ncbi:MAG: M15 family metallopeptidase [Oscillospiraceae bacterium]|jgi:D-alanyl-D-alanine dipeptidase|nr:M15 family metallopeptidase [Oscillospiraceae bacterium]
MIFTRNISTARHKLQQALPIVLFAVTALMLLTSCGKTAHGSDITPLPGDSCNGPPLAITTPTPGAEPAASAELASRLPDGFVYVTDVNSSIRVDLRYAGPDNFTGAPADGYKSATAAILTREAALALSKAQQRLQEEGLGLLIYDAYRPQSAVDYFMRWTENDDISHKADYYPKLSKSALPGAYIGRRSGHSRGSTVDVTLADASSGEPLDMGSPFDLFDPISSHGAAGLTAEQSENRLKLKGVMETFGFKAYDGEYWHYTLSSEPFPDTYFDFDVK